MPFTTQSWSALRIQLQDRLELKRFWSDQELLDATNEGLYLWNLLTGTWRTTQSITTVAGQYDYVLSSSLLYRTRLTYNTLPLSPSSRTELNLGRPKWRTETTTSGGDVPSRPTLFAPISLQLIYLWPADAVGGGTLLVEGVAATPILVEEADTIDLADETLNVLLGYALHVLSFKKGGPAFAATQPLFKAFLAEAAEQNSRIKTTTFYRKLMGLDWRSLKMLTGTPTGLDQFKESSGVTG